MSDRCWNTVSSPLLLGHLPGLVCGLLQSLHDQIVLLHMQPSHIKVTKPLALQNMAEDITHHLHLFTCLLRKNCLQQQKMTYKEMRSDAGEFLNTIKFLELTPWGIVQLQSIPAARCSLYPGLQ